MIKLKFNQVFLLAFLLQMCFITTGFAQQQGAKEEAIAYFKKENYQSAYPLFVQLHELYSSDPLMNYYYGVSKVKVGRFDQDIITSLRSALVSNQTPTNALFYLGQSYHAFEQYEKAIDAYARFEEKSKKKEQKQLEVKKFKELAYEKKNPFSLAVGRSRVERIKEEKEQKQLAEVKKEIKEESGVTNIQDEKSSSKSIQLDNYDIHFNINSTLTYHRVGDFKEASARQLYLKGLELKMKRVGLSETIDSLRKEFNSIERDQNSYSKSEAESKRQSLTDEIIKLEHKLYPLLKQEQQRFAQSKVVEQTYWKDYSLNKQKAYANELLKKYDPEAVLFETKVEEAETTPKEPVKSLTSPPVQKQEAPKEMVDSTKINTKSTKKDNIPTTKSSNVKEDIVTAQVAETTGGSKKANEAKPKVETNQTEAPQKSKKIDSPSTKKEIKRETTSSTTKSAQKNVVTNTVKPTQSVVKKEVTTAAVVTTTSVATSSTKNEPKKQVENVDVPSVSFDEDMTFEVANNTPTTTPVETQNTNKIVEKPSVKKDKTESPKAYYAIQIVASKGDVSDDVKNKVSTAVSAPLHYYSKGTTRYYIVGYFNNLKEAATTKSSLRSGGFSDAFTVALNEKGERISFADAKKLLQ
ncbi:hypothetical protein K5X82_17890 [Halosquirtibacter xylanolyticus]|uniref:hypothetical protein n=1 Tax=Halosquirtibacter xylanolyticus TaxID=3374599 RepID=UPI003748D52D|nr:hypothetical protein K5X82_17890 [Prolixibacteraceae bacterium]